MAGDGGSEDPRVKPAPSGEDGVYYVEVRVETLVQAAPTRAPPDSLLPSGNSRTPRTKPLRRRMRDAEASPLASLVPRT